MVKEFLGVGWKFPIQRDRSGRVAMSRHEDHIQESVQIILGTAIGERVMRPDFGCGIHNLVFAPNSETVQNQARYYCREALIAWEPRIEVQEVTTRTDPGDDATLMVQISYRVRATNNEFNLVYPFYLKLGAER